LTGVGCRVQGAGGERESERERERELHVGGVLERSVRVDPET
jgi:hypothetical protein